MAFMVDDWGRDVNLEKRKVTAMIGGQSCSFFSDDPDEFVAELVRRANAVMKQTARFSGLSSHMNAVLSVVSLTDALMRAEREKEELARLTNLAESQAEARRIKKPPVKTPEEDKAQITVWELLENQTAEVVDNTQESAWDLLEKTAGDKTQVSMWDLLGDPAEKRLK